MNTNLLAFGIASFAMVGLVVSIGGASLLVGGLERYLGAPKFILLKSGKGISGLAFHLKWNAAKEPVRFNIFKIRLFNPFGTPSQIEIVKSFDPKDESFAKDFDMGPDLEKLIESISDKTTLQVTLESSLDGVVFHFDYKGMKFLEEYRDAKGSVGEVEFAKGPIVKDPNYGVIPRQMVADTVPGKGPKLKIPTNPEFAGEFSGAAEGGADAPAVENFAISKVWIEPGCIVCNACEDIYPEVFEVLADTCIIRPGPPLDDGLKIQEAAEACPVEVIKFNKA